MTLTNDQIKDIQFVTDQIIYQGLKTSLVKYGHVDELRSFMFETAIRVSPKWNSAEASYRTFLNAFLRFSHIDFYRKEHTRNGIKKISIDSSSEKELAPFKVKVSFTEKFDSKLLVKEILSKALGSSFGLTVVEKKIFYMRFVKGDSQYKIADKLGITQSAICKRQDEIIHKIREALGIEV